MPGIFSRFGRGSERSLADRHRMMLLAMDLFEQDNSVDQVEAALKDAGVSRRGGAAGPRHGRNRVERGGLRSTSPATTAHHEVNHYFPRRAAPTAATARTPRGAA